MGGAAEMLRSLLMVQLGSEPEGLTEGTRQEIERYRGRLEPGDVVRMLRLLTDAEPLIRRSGNPRLVVETLLLRWAMMDRTVNLQEVLEGGRTGGQEGGRTGGRADRRTGETEGGPGAGSRAVPDGPVANPPAGRVLRDAAPDQEPSVPPPVRPSGAPTDLSTAWPEILIEVRSRSRFLGEALAATAPGPVEAGALPLVLAESNPLFAERIQAEASSVEDVIRKHTGSALRIRVSVAPGQPPVPKPQPLTESSLRADRLRSFRAKDPTLDTAADALDLEIVD
jgi:DNA polymerase-3 subunit gamma/tau